MFSYYLKLALRSLKRNVVLTAAHDRGHRCRHRRLDDHPDHISRHGRRSRYPRSPRSCSRRRSTTGDPRTRRWSTGDEEHLQDQITYTDAVNLMNAHAAARQTAMYVTGLPLTPPNRELLPFQVQARATYTDFFTMFDVPFLYGGPWSASDDDGPRRRRGHYARLERSGLRRREQRGSDVEPRQSRRIESSACSTAGSRCRNSTISPPANTATESSSISPSRAPSKATWKAGNRATAPAIQASRGGTASCVPSASGSSSGWSCRPRPMPLAIALSSTTTRADQQRAGRFNWPPRTRLRDVREWLAHWHVVSDEVRILVLVAFSFLFVCLLNAMGLMLAKIMDRAGDIGVRRALGANRGAIFGQCLIEAGVVGLAGGLVGLALTALGLAGVRLIVSPSHRPAHASQSDRYRDRAESGGVRHHPGRAVSHLARRACSAGLATQGAVRSNPWNWLSF